MNSLVGLFSIVMAIPHSDLLKYTPVSKVPAIPRTAGRFTVRSFKDTYYV